MTQFVCTRIGAQRRARRQRKGDRDFVAPEIVQGKAARVLILSFGEYGLEKLVEFGHIESVFLWALLSLPFSQETSRPRLEEILVGLNKVLLSLRDIVLGEDSFHRTDRQTGSAVNALIRVNKVHFSFVVRMNAVYGAHLHTGCVFYSNTKLSDYICHA